MPDSPNRNALKKYFEKLTHEELIEKCIGLALHAHNVESMADERIHGQNKVLAQLAAECERVHVELKKYRNNEHLPGAVVTNPVIMEDVTPVSMLSSSEIRSRINRTHESTRRSPRG